MHIRTKISRELLWQSSFDLTSSAENIWRRTSATHVFKEIGNPPQCIKTIHMES